MAASCANRYTPQAADRKYPRTRTHKTRRWKMRCTEVAVAPRVALERTYFIARALIPARSGILFYHSFFFAGAYAPLFYFFLFCFFSFLPSSRFTLYFRASRSRPPVITYTTLLLFVSLSPSLSYFFTLVFFLRAVYSRTCQRINIFMRTTALSRGSSLASDMHTYVYPRVPRSRIFFAADFCARAIPLVSSILLVMGAC